MDPRRLETLVQLSRTESMREVAEDLGVTTSTVSQQISALAKEVGMPLVEPVGRRIRLTPGGRRLAEHAVTILAAIEAARLDLDPDAEPAGTLRVAGFATAVRRSLLPLVADLAVNHPAVRLRIHEHEPFEALDLLDHDDVDLALVYDYNLAPESPESTVELTPLWQVPWGLGLPDEVASATKENLAEAVGTNSVGVFQAFRDHEWIVNSRNTADERVVRTVASMAGFVPTVTHRVDNLELVQDLIAEGLGVAILPMAQPTRRGVTVLPLSGPDVMLRAYAAVRRGRTAWPPLELVLGRLQQ